jgi:citrate lyase subunit beta/citryl-CoA lyase
MPSENRLEAPRPLRSMLFVPADDEKKLAKGVGVPADALILDLEDSVKPARKARARELAAEFLGDLSPGTPEVWIRVNALQGPECDADIACAVAAQAAGIVLPKVRGPADVVELGRRLDELEPRSGREPGTTRVVPIATETPAGVLALSAYGAGVRRLAALTWGAEDLAAALGASTNVDDEGRWLAPYELARSLCLLAAAAADVPAVDTVYTKLHDPAGLERFAARARRDGFRGALAIHPEQVEILNATFGPSPSEIADAARVVAAFAAAPDAGVVALDDRMLDRPHLARAERLLAIAASLDNRAASSEPRAKHGRS